MTFDRVSKAILLGLPIEDCCVGKKAAMGELIGHGVKKEWNCDKMK
jgi:hypothetical protein